MKENVCKLNTCFSRKLFLFTRKFKRLFMDNYFTTLSLGSLVKSSCDGIRRKVPMSSFIIINIMLYFYVFLIQFYKFVLFLQNL